MKTLKASYALLIAAGLLMTGLLNTVMATNYYWDGNSGTQLQPTNGVWADANWNTASSGLGTLVTWPGESTNNAYVCTTTGTNFITISSTASVNQLGLGWTGSAGVNSTFNKLTNGTLRVGAGGIICAGDKNTVNDQAIWSDIVLTTNQTWNTIALLCVYGSITDGGSGYGITKTGANALSLYSTNNTFSGGVTLSLGTLNINSTSAIGTGTFIINGGTINNSTAALITNTQNNAMSWNGNFSFGGNSDLNMGTGAVTLGTNVVFTESGTRTLTVGGLGGSYGFTRTGPGILSFSGNSSFSGGLTINSGTIQSTLSGSGTPFGSSNIVLVGNGNPVTSGNGATQLKLVPEVTGTTSLTGGTDAGSLFSFANTVYFYLARKDASSSLSYTFGPGSGTVLSRVGKGVLVIQDNISGVPTSLGISGGNNFIINGTAPTTNNGMVEAYYLGGRSGGQGDAIFLTYDATYGFKPVTYDYAPAAGTLTPTGWNNTKKVKLGGTSTLNTDASVYALSVENGSSAYFTNNATLTIGDGTRVAGLLINSAAIYGSGTINFGTSEGLIYVGNSPVIANVVAGSGGLTKAQYDGTGYKLILTANPTYTGLTTINNGTLEFSGSAVSLGAVQGPGSLQYAGIGTMTVSSVSNMAAVTLSGTGALTLSTVNTVATITRNAGSTALTLNNVTGVTTLTDNSTTGSTLPTTINQSGTGLTIGTINGVSGSLVNFTSSDTTGSTTIANSLATTGQLIKVTSGTVTLNGRNTTSDLQVDGGLLRVTSSRLGLNGRATLAQTLTITGGQVLVPSTSDFGVRLNGDTGSAAGGVANNLFAGTQTGGVFSILKGASTTSFSMGSTSAETSTFNLQGGLLNILGTGTDGRIDLGSDTAGTGKTTFNFSGGKLVVSSQIAGSQGTGARQAFVWTGGTLATAAYIAANLTSLDGAAYAGNVGTLVNNGGTLAPGDIGTAGKTTVTGSYSNTPSAMLAIDIGGPALGNAFTNGVGYYDTLSVSATSTVTGRLDVSLINGYIPLATNKFTVLTSSTALSGGFDNVFADGPTNRIWCADGYSRFDVLFNTTAKTVILTNYAVNVWGGAPSGAWTTGANWSLATEPNGSAFGAYFGTGGSGTVTVDTARTVRGLTFTNSSASYTIAGAALTLQGDMLTAPKISVLAGSHTISAAMALSNATTIAVDGLTSLLSLTGGITGGQAVTKTGTGTLALSAANTLGALAVSAGTVQFAAGMTTVNALSITAGATCDFTAGTLYIQKNGGGIDTIEEVSAEITANRITLRGSNALPVDFKVTEEGLYVKVTAKLKGTMITVM